jgi:hypothetical protein
MKRRMSLGVSLLLVGMLAACDRTSPYDKGPANEGNVSVMANEGRLVGRGRMEVDGHTVAVKMSRVPRSITAAMVIFISCWSMVKSVTRPRRSSPLALSSEDLASPNAGAGLHRRLCF